VLTLPSSMRIFIATEAAGMRCGFDMLAAMTQGGCGYAIVCCSLMRLVTSSMRESHVTGSQFPTCGVVKAQMMLS